MRAAALALGLMLGFLAIEHPKPAPQQRKARELHRMAVERPRTHHNIK